MNVMEWYSPFPFVKFARVCALDRGSEKASPPSPTHTPRVMPHLLFDIAKIYNNNILAKTVLLTFTD